MAFNVNEAYDELRDFAFNETGMKKPEKLKALAALMVDCLKFTDDDKPASKEDKKKLADILVAFSAECLSSNLRSELIKKVENFEDKKSLEGFLKAIPPLQQSKALKMEQVRPLIFGALHTNRLLQFNEAEVIRRAIELIRKEREHNFSKGLD